MFFFPVGPIGFWGMLFLVVAFSRSLPLLLIVLLVMALFLLWLKIADACDRRAEARRLPPGVLLLTRPLPPALRNRSAPVARPLRIEPRF